MPSNIILLDAAMGLLLIVPLFFILHFGSTLLIEAAILKRIGYKSFKAALVDVLIANIASMAVGLIWINKFPYWGDMSRKIFIFSMLFAITWILETALLGLLNRSFPFKKLILPSLLMNALTYVILVLLWALAGQL